MLKHNDIFHRTDLKLTFSRAKRGFNAVLRMKMGLKCIFNISFENWNKLKEIENQAVLNHQHKYPQIDKNF